MRRLASAACFVGFVAALEGCSSGGDTPRSTELVATSSSRIISGTDSTSDQDAVVLLALRSGGQLEGTCTGTLVAPNLVLTARHCVSETDRGAVCTKDGTPLREGAVLSDHQPSELYVYTGADGIRYVNDGNRAAARGKSVLHETISNICDADIAFIVLDRSVQGRIAPIRVSGGVREGEKLTAVGWGLTNDGTLPTTRQQRDNISVVAVGPVTLDQQSNIGLGGSEFLVRESFCSGDSGGPSFSSKGAVVGVVSRGGGGAENPTNEAANCIGSSVINFYTHLSEKAGLVAAAFKAAGAEPRTEGDAPGLGVGEKCDENLDCSSDACVKGKCERRCDDGSKCAAAEVCTPFEEKKICRPAPDEPAPVKNPEAEQAEPAAAPKQTTTTTTTTGCSAAPRSTGTGGGVVGVALTALAFVATRRRRAR